MLSSKELEVHMVSFKSSTTDGYSCIIGTANLTEAHVIALEEYAKKIRAAVEAWKIEEIEKKMGDLKIADEHPGNQFA